MDTFLDELESGVAFNPNHTLTGLARCEIVRHTPVKSRQEAFTPTQLSLVQKLGKSVALVCAQFISLPNSQLRPLSTRSID